MLFDEQTINLLKAVLKKNGHIDIPAQGTSMFPFIQEGNLCRFIVCEPQELKKGEVVLFHLETGQLTAHRYYGSKMMNNKSFFVFKGDTNLGFDQPVCEERIIGKLLYVQKEKSLLNVSDFRAFFWGKLILLFPMLSSILRQYLNRKSNILY
ncbi:hypothetical protein V7068_22280 [Bacillus sp. JJ634]